MKNDIKKFLLLIMAIVGVAIFSGAASAATLDKTTVIIRADTTFDYKDLNKKGWRPQVDFRVYGPIAKGSQISIAMTTPDGKPWLSFDCRTTATEAGEALFVDACGRGDVPTDKISAALGVYGLKIELKNELKGTNETLLTGKFKVGKAFNGATPVDKDNYVWYVDYDWALPVAEVFPDAYETMYGVKTEKEAQPLKVSFWFRGYPNDTVGYLFYNGKQIANTENTSSGGVSNEQGVTLFSYAPFAWTKQVFNFTNVYVKNTKDPNQLVAPFFMEKNPGEYEVKVLFNKKLARTLKFTVGSDGRIVDSGISSQNALGTSRITLFANTSGDDDGKKPDFQAWKSTAFFEGPLKGFGGQ
jgi:hypothetical protein